MLNAIDNKKHTYQHLDSIVSLEKQQFIQQPTILAQSPIVHPDG